MLEAQLRVAGVGLLLLAAMHAGFPRRFGWASDLPRLSLLNRQIFAVHTLFIAVTVAFFGALSLVLAGRLDRPDPLSRTLLAGFCLFWTLRLAVQIFVFDARLWRGHRFETAMHLAFTCLWAYLAVLYGVAFARQF